MNRQFMEEQCKCLIMIWSQRNENQSSNEICGLPRRLANSNTEITIHAVGKGGMGTFTNC